MLTKILKDIRDVFVFDYQRHQVIKQYRQHAAAAVTPRREAVNPFSGPHCEALLRVYEAQYAPAAASFSYSHMQSELLPFFLMDADTAPKALAEYFIFKKTPERAQTTWLRDEINRAFYGATAWTQTLQGVLTRAVAINAPWLQLIEDDVMNSIYNRLLLGPFIKP